MRGARLTGVGAFLPDKVLTNADLTLKMDTTDEWIAERTGIRERRIGGTTAGLSAEAGRIALDKAGVAPEDIDLLIVATTSPDHTCPGTSPKVQELLGLDCGAFDLQAACSGWVYGLVAAHGFVHSGMDKILIIGAETLSRITDYEARDTGILFGDGAGAAVLESCDGPGELLGWDLGANGSLTHILYAEPGDTLVMDGKEVFRQAIRVIVDTTNKTLANAGVSIDDVDLVIPHQANLRIIESAMKRLDVPMDKVVTILQRTGNTSAASIPLALDDAMASDRIKEGDLVLFAGFGAGMTWASALVRWGG